MENAPGAHGEESTMFGQKHLLEHCPKKPHWETAPNSGLSWWQTQVCLSFASLGHFLPSRGILAQMCLTHGRELPIPEHQIHCWREWWDGGGKSKGSCCSHLGELTTFMVQHVHLHLRLSSINTLFCFTLDDRRVLIGHEEIHQAAAWCSRWVPTASGSCRAAPGLAAAPK